MMTGFEPGLQTLRRERDRIRPSDADGVEAQCLGTLDKSALEGLPV
ncbi:hypothetical protein [Microvirga terrestris]